MADDVLIDPTARLNELQEYKDAIIDDSYSKSARGSYTAQYQSFLTQVDRYGVNPMLDNQEHVGLTFITRPQLNLSTTSLRQDSVINQFNTMDNTSMPFSIRCYLDPKWAGSPMIAPLAANSPFVNTSMPFLVSLTNGLVDFSGTPDFILDTETYGQGFHGEDYTMVAGSTFNRSTIDLQMTFQDINGGYNLALIYLWEYFIALQAKGVTSPYGYHIDQRRLNYTCSIYRFTYDVTMSRIVHSAKFTGCMPVNTPFSSIFNISSGTRYIEGARSFPVTFKCNVVEFNSPDIFNDFNQLMRMFNGPRYHENKELYDVSPYSEYNFKGLPYIDLAEGKSRMKFLSPPEELVDQTERKYALLMNRILQEAA